MTPRLAYVFWHRPAEGLEPGAYEAALRRFHSALAASQPAGFILSVTLRADPVPWLGDGGRGYEDWYLVESSAALDALDAAAVGPTAGAAHGEAARHAAEGIAGLYRLYAGTPQSAMAPGAANWLDLPAATAAGLAAEIGARGGLWRRQMTLGPTPEFCVLGKGRSLPTAARHQVVVARARLGD